MPGRQGRTYSVPAVLALVVAWAGAVHAAAYLVSPEGTMQGDGSREKPFSVGGIPKEKLRPGDEVVFLDGVYRAPLVIASIGNEKGPIVYRAENRHKAIFDGGTPIAGWKPTAGQEGVWEARVGTAPQGVLCDGEGLISAESTWRRDGKKSLDEGMFACEKIAGDPTALDEKKGGTLVSIHPWAGREPKEVFAVAGSIVQVGGAYNIVDGLLIRRGVYGVGLGGKQVHTYKQEAGPYLDVSGLVNNSYGSFNIVRNCIIRDQVGCGMASNESRFNLIEDCVIYNAGMGQGDHGIYISQGAENLVLRRNVWWRISGGGIHIYSGTGIDSPRGIVVERNVFGPDKRNRCFPLKGRKSAAIYVWGGSRWAGGNRIVGNLVLGPVDRAVSMNRSYFNLVAHNTFLGCDGAPIQLAETFGDVIANNILEYAPGSDAHPDGYIHASGDGAALALSRIRSNLLLPRGGQGKEVPAWMESSRISAADPFIDRPAFDFRLKPDSAAIGFGIPLPNFARPPQGKAPDAGALQLSDDRAKLPEIPKWLLDEWPLSKRGQ